MLCYSMIIGFWFDAFYQKADVALSNSLSEELKYEKESVADSDKEPDFLREFKAQGKWQVSISALNTLVPLNILLAD